MTEGCGGGCGGGGPTRSATSAGAAPPQALITCCYWSVKFEYAFSLLKVWLVLARGQQQKTVWLLPGCCFLFFFPILCFDLLPACALVLLGIMHSSSNAPALCKLGRKVNGFMCSFSNGKCGLSFGFLCPAGLK